MSVSYRSAPISLYDMVAPGVDRHLMTRNAIEMHRNGERPPVQLWPKVVQDQ